MAVTRDELNKINNQRIDDAEKALDAYLRLHWQLGETIFWCGHDFLRKMSLAEIKLLIERYPTLEMSYTPGDDDDDECEAIIIQA